MAHVFIGLDEDGDAIEYPINSLEEIALAQEALSAEGIESADVWVGDGLDSYENGSVLHATRQDNI